MENWPENAKHIPLLEKKKAVFPSATSIQVNGDEAVLFIPANLAFHMAFWEPDMLVWKRKSLAKNF